MLSNRESARRSRHRKQAHMHDLESKVDGIEAENEALKLSLAKAHEQEICHNAERTQLYAEIAALRSKVFILLYSLVKSCVSCVYLCSTKANFTYEANDRIYRQLNTVPQSQALHDLHIEDESRKQPQKPVVKQ